MKHANLMHCAPLHFSQSSSISDDLPMPKVSCSQCLVVKEQLASLLVSQQCQRLHMFLPTQKCKISIIKDVCTCLL